MEELERGQGQTSFVPLSSWVTLGKLSMSSLPEIHTHLESQIVVVPYVDMGSLQMSAVKDLWINQCWIRWALNPMTGVLKRKEGEM